MSVTLTLVTVVAFSFVAGEGVRRVAERRNVILSGAEYAVIGLLVGPLALNLLSPSVLSALQHGVSLLLGLVGFILGLRLKRVQGRTFRRVVAGVVMGALSSAGIALCTAGVLAYATPDFGGLEVRPFVVAMVVLGSAGSVASARLHRSAVDRLAAAGPLIETLEVAAVTSAVLAILAAGVMMDWQRAIAVPVAFGGLQPPEQLWIALGLAVGVVCGMLFVFFQRGEKSDERTFLATIGVVIFASGVASALGSSPLLVGLVAGVTVSFALPRSRELSAQLHQIEHPVSIALMLFAGALFVPVGGAYLLLPVVYVVSRAASVALWSRIVLRPVLPAGRSRFAAAGMRSQGTIPIAIGVSLALAHPELAPVMNAVLIGVLVFEVGAGRALRRTLADAGELGNVEVTA